MKVFKTKNFSNWATNEDISDEDLLSAVDQMVKGLIGTNLGGNLYKKRVARAGEGKSGGFRTFIGCRLGNKAFYLHGFSKSERDNIDKKEKKVLKEIAADMLNMSEENLKKALNNKVVIEILSKDGTNE